MLTLTRKVGESIQIGDDVIISIREVRKNQVRISIEAPRDTKIWRSEVYTCLAETRQSETPNQKIVIYGGYPGEADEIKTRLEEKGFDVGFVKTSPYSDAILAIDYNKRTYTNDSARMLVARLAPRSESSQARSQNAETTTAG